MYTTEELDAMQAAADDRAAAEAEEAYMREVHEHQASLVDDEPYPFRYTTDEF